MIVGKLEVKQTDLELRHWRPFNIEPIEGKEALKTMQRGCEILQKTQTNYWISSGNLLGVVRDKKLIPHDTDIDVNVSLEFDSLDANIKSKQILLGFTNDKFEVIRTVVYKNHFMQLAFMDTKTDVIFDIYFFYSGIEARFGVNLNPEGVIKKPIKFINRTNILVYNGVTYPIPRYLTQFMEWRFGKDWRTPAKSKIPWQNEAPNLIKWK